MRSLEHEGVKTLFGYPGGAIMPVFDALYDHRDRLNHILVRHEQGAAHAAQGFARVSGEVGVCLVTSGPGATNTITGVADAMIDSTPRPSRFRNGVIRYAGRKTWRGQYRARFTSHGADVLVRWCSTLRRMRRPN